MGVPPGNVNSLPQSSAAQHVSDRTSRTPCLLDPGTASLALTKPVVPLFRSPALPLQCGSLFWTAGCELWIQAPSESD